MMYGFKPQENILLGVILLKIVSVDKLLIKVFQSFQQCPLYFMNLLYYLIYHMKWWQVFSILEISCQLLLKSRLIHINDMRFSILPGDNIH